MPNDVDAYNPIFYASEALIHLRKALGMASRIHRGYEQERQSYNLGSVIAVKSPGTFTAQDPISGAQDLETKEVNITLDKNPGVAYTITDVDLAYTGQRVIDDHIAPAAYAIADKIDQYIVELYKDVPWLYDYTTATDHTIITGTKQVAWTNGVPFNNDGNVHFGVDGSLQMVFENSQIFHSANTTGSGNNPTLFAGGLGDRFGAEIFANQNIGTSALHVPGTANQAAGDSVGAVNSNPLLKGATVMAIDGMTGSETIAKGDTFVIAGNTQRYSVTADTTLTTGANAAMPFFPSAVQQYADGAVITFTKQNDAGSVNHLMFHRNFAALAMVPLTDNTPGIESFTATDPVSGLALRARRWSTGIPAATWVALDALVGVKTLNPNLAVRAWT